MANFVKKIQDTIDPYYNFVFTSMFTSSFDQNERVVLL